MKKKLLLFLGALIALMSYTTKVTAQQAEPVTITWDFSEEQFNWTEPDTLQIPDEGLDYRGMLLKMKFVPNSGIKDYVNKAYGFRPNGSSSSTNRYIQYKPEYDGTLKVYYASNNATATDRITAVGTAVKTFKTDVIPDKVPDEVIAYGVTNGNTVLNFEAKLTKGETYYIYMANGGQRISKLEFTYTPSQDPQPAEASYYVVGTMNDWKASDEYKLATNAATEGEYMTTLQLAKDDEFKVIKVEGETTTWYPDGMDNNLKVEVSGEYDIYFRPDGQGGQDWYDGYIYLALKDEPAVSYTVHLDEGQVNGTVEADKYEVAENEQVLLKVTPNENYEIDQVSVITVTGAPIDIQPIVGGDYNYSFVMPGGDVYVSATFKEQAGDSYYYQKVTSTADITDGTYLIVYEGDSKHNAVAFNGGLETLDASGNGVAVTITDGAIAASDQLDAAVFTIDATNGTLKAANGNYVGAKSYGNGLAVSEKADDFAHQFSITDGAFVDGIVFDGGTVTMRYNYASDQLRFRYYKSGQQAVALYKKVKGEGPQPPVEIEIKSMAIVGDFLGLEATGESNNPNWDPANGWQMTKEDTNPNIWTLKKEGVVVEGKKYEYKATANGNWDDFVLPAGDNANFVFGTNEYPAGTYDLTFTANVEENTLTLVAEQQGVEPQPEVLTIAQAIALIDENQGAKVENVSVEGIISQIDSFNSKYGSITYWISADGSTEGQQFEVYSGLNIGGEKFTSKDDIEVGAKVVVTGDVKKYNDVYEFDYNNQLVSYEAPEPVAGIESMAINGTFPGMSWDADKGIAMTQDADNKAVWTLTMENVTVEGQKYEYKAFANGETTGYQLPAEGAGNNDFVFGTDMYPAGTYTLTFTANTSTHKLTLEANKPIETIKELNAQADGKKFSFAGNAIVVAKAVRGGAYDATNNNVTWVYVKDETGNSLIYDNQNGQYLYGINPGDVIKAPWTGNVIIYNKLFEAVPDASLEASSSVLVEIPEATPVDVTAENVNKVVKIKGLTIASVDDKNNINFTIGNDAVPGYNQFRTPLPEVTEGKTFDVVGAISRYNDNIQFWPIAIIEVVAPEPQAFSVGFTTDKEWKQVYAYTWKGEVVPNNWPGVEITESLKEGVYTYAFEAAEAPDFIIFNNGNQAEVNEQTGDLPFVNGTTYTFSEEKATAWAGNPDVAIEETGIIIPAETLVKADVQAEKIIHIVAKEISTAAPAKGFNSDVAEFQASDILILKNDGTNAELVPASAIEAVDDGYQFKADLAIVEEVTKNGLIVKPANDKKIGIELVEVEKAKAPAQGLIPDGTYYIMNADAGKVLNAERKLDSKGTPVTITFNKETKTYTITGYEAYPFTVKEAVEGVSGYYHISTIVEGNEKYFTGNVDGSTTFEASATDAAVWIFLQQAYWEDIVNSTYTVAGTKNLTGTENDWEVAEANKMTYNEETALYEITYKNIAVSNDVKPAFKVVKQPMEGEAIWYPEGDATTNWVITPDVVGGEGNFDITITFDPSDSKEIKVTALQIVDLNLNPDDGADLTAVLANAGEGKKVRNITINLAENGAYTVSGPIVAGGNVVINGNGATVDASALAGNFIEMAVVENPTEWTEANLTISGITVKGLKKALFYSACKNYFGDVTVDKCVVEQAADATTFDYTKGSTAVNFTVTNSTFYAPTATTKSFYSSQGGQKTTEYNAEAVQTFTFTNNTMYNLAPGKNFFTHRQANQKWLAYNVKNNIFVNCGKSGQVIKGMNGGQSGSNPTWSIDNNIFNFEVESVMTDTSAAEDTGDTTEGEGVQNSVAGVVTFTDATAGNFNGVITVENVVATVPGDPRWTITQKIDPVDVVVEAADITDGDITAAIAAKAAGKPINNLTVNLAEGAYTVSAAMKAGGNIAINGNGATVDASALEGNFIEMAVVDAPTEWTEANLTISGITVKGLKKALFYSSCKNYFGNVSVDNCVVEQAADATTFDYTKGSTAVNFTVTNSTFYAPTATTKSFYSSQGGQKTTEYNAEAVQTFTFTNNTMYNLAPGKNFFSHRQANQKWMAYNVKNNIFVNCGKSGQVIKGMNGGQGGTNPTWTIDGNLFNFDGADTGAAEVTGDADEPIQNTIAGVVTFTDATAGDFNATLGVALNPAEPTIIVGDPRWTITATQVPVDIVIAPTEGSDISTAVQTASEGKKVKDIYVYLAPGKKFTISKSIVAPAAFVIMGAADGTNPSDIDENATMAEIDASALDGPMVKMSETPAVAADVNGFYPLNDVGFLNVKVTGLTQQLFYANKQKYLINCFHVDFCNINVAGGSKTIIDTNGGGVIATLDMSKNTIWANPENTGALYSSQSGQKATEAGLAVQTFNIERNTMYNIAKGKNFCSHRQSNQTWLTYNVKNNTFVNCGKSGQVIKGLNGGSGGANPTWEISGNAFNFDGADTSASESTGDADHTGDETPGLNETVQNSIAGVFVFNDAANGDFNGVFKGQTAEAPAKYPGDPRWTYTYEAPAKFYIIGNMNSWDRTAMTEMTFNAETQAYEYEYAPTTTAYFAFADKQLTADEAAADEDWAIFNATNRYAIGTGDVDATLNEAVALQKVNGAIVLKPVKEGTSYKISVAKDLSTVTITGEAAPEPEPTYTVAGAFVVGEDNLASFFGTAWDPTAAANDMEKQEDGTYKKVYENVSFTEIGQIQFKIAENHSWDVNYGWDGYNAFFDVTAPATNVTVTFTFDPNGATDQDKVKIDVKSASTAINGIDADDADDNTPIYNLSGQKVTKSYKGVVIKNGKKIYQK